MSIRVFYRISDAGYNKVKPDYVNNENCLRNCVKHFGSDIDIIADNVSDETFDMVEKYVYPLDNIKRTNIKGGNAGSFTMLFENALLLDDETIVYFLEDDYLHRENSANILLEGFELGGDYVTLYDHPDKYMSPEMGGNKRNVDGPEETRVYCSKSTHWKLTNSTTLTFASKIKTLKEDESIIRKYTNGFHPETHQKTGAAYDHSLWVHGLINNGRRLLSPIPGYSTHGEIPWMSNFINWENE